MDLFGLLKSGGFVAISALMVVLSIAVSRGYSQRAPQPDRRQVLWMALALPLVCSGVFIVIPASLWTPLVDMAPLAAAKWGVYWCIGSSVAAVLLATVLAALRYTALTRRLALPKVIRATVVATHLVLAVFPSGLFLITSDLSLLRQWTEPSFAVIGAHNLMVVYLTPDGNSLEMRDLGSLHNHSVIDIDGTREARPSEAAVWLVAKLESPSTVQLLLCETKHGAREVLDQPLTRVSGVDATPLYSNLRLGSMLSSSIVREPGTVGEAPPQLSTDELHGLQVQLESSRYHGTLALPWTDFRCTEAIRFSDTLVLARFGSNIIFCVDCQASTVTPLVRGIRMLVVRTRL